MNRSQLLAAIERHWLEQGIAHGPPVSVEEIAAFETRYGVRLPADLRAHSLVLNGCEHGSCGPMDGQLISFWHFAEFRPLAEARIDSGVPGAESLFVVADWSISAHEYAVRLTAEPTSSGGVVVIYDEFPVEIAPSFTAFLEGYVAANEAMLFPEPLPAWRAKYGNQAV